MTPAEKLSAGKKRSVTRIKSDLVLDCRVRDLRVALKLSQRDVAKAVGTSDATVCFVENGSNVGMVIALKLAAFFGKTVEEIWSLKAVEDSKERK